MRLFGSVCWLLGVFLIQVLTHAPSAVAFSSPTWSNATTNVSNSDFDTGTLLFPAQPASQISIQSVGSGYYHNHGGAPVTASIEVLLNGVWTLVFTGPAASSGSPPSGGVALSSWPTVLGTFAQGQVSGVRLACARIISQCFHSVSGTMFFELTNDTQKTSQTIQRFLKRRNDMLMSNGPNLNRWIERLTNNNGSGDNGGAGFALGGGQASANGGGANAATLSSATANRAVNDQVQREPYALGGPSAHKSGVGASINSVFASSNLFDNASVGPAGAPTSTLPLGFTIGDESGNRMSFSTSLMQVAQATAESKRRKFAGGEEELAKLGINGASPASPKQFGLDIWVEGHIVHFDEGEDGGKSDGDFGVLYFGADYVLSPHILIGALVQFDKMSEMSVDRSTKTEGHGWMIGPYATVRLSNNLFVQGRAAWGQSENDISPFLTSTDTYDTERWLVEGSIQGRWAAGSLTISPRASIGYIEEDQEAYTDSFGVLIPTQTISLGQARFGPQVSYQLRASDGTTVEPYAEIEAIWNFDESGTNLVASTLASTQDWRGKAGIGVRAVSSGGVALDLSGAYDGIGTDDLDAISGEAKLRFPLN